MVVSFVITRSNMHPSSSDPDIPLELQACLAAKEHATIQSLHALEWAHSLCRFFIHRSQIH